MTADQTASRSILLVEDEPILLMLIAETLRDAGYQVHEASEGQTAIALLRAHPDIALLMTDIRMPGMNGYQLADAAMTLRENLKILLMTGYTDQDIPKTIADLGIRLMHKPFDVEKLPVYIEEII
jgi:CheY-like chemotaxis protein